MSRCHTISRPPAIHPSTMTWPDTSRNARGTREIRPPCISAKARLAVIHRSSSGVSMKQKESWLISGLVAQRWMWPLCHSLQNVYEMGGGSWQLYLRVPELQYCVWASCPRGVRHVSFSLTMVPTGSGGIRPPQLLFPSFLFFSVFMSWLEA